MVVQLRERWHGALALLLLDNVTCRTGEGDSLKKRRPCRENGEGRRKKNVRSPFELCALRLNFERNVRICRSFRLHLTVFSFLESLLVQDNAYGISLDTAQAYLRRARINSPRLEK